MEFENTLLDDFIAAMQKGELVSFSDIRVNIFPSNGRQIVMATDMLRDPIQRHHRNGKFYEAMELELLKDRFPANGVFVDIGANVGNHSVFVATHLDPSRVIPFEPNPLAYKLLLANIHLNGLTDRFDLSNIGFGAGSEPSGGFGMQAVSRNLGGAKMIEGSGDIQITTGDIALSKTNVDLIKIDIEGMEMLALAGLKETLKRCRPNLMVEVTQENYDAFEQYVAVVGYEIETLREIEGNKNYFMRPKSV